MRQGGFQTSLNYNMQAAIELAAALRGPPKRKSLPWGWWMSPLPSMAGDLVPRPSVFILAVGAHEHGGHHGQTAAGAGEHVVITHRCQK